MLSNKPYLIRAFYDWIVDSQCTPFLVINANHPRCKIPSEYVENGQITLNVSPEAIRELIIGNEYVEFQASFSGMVHYISAPTKMVLAVYAQENGEGMFFDFEEETDDAVTLSAVDNINPASSVESARASSENKKRPAYLKLVE